LAPEIAHWAAIYKCLPQGSIKMPHKLCHEWRPPWSPAIKSAPSPQRSANSAPGETSAGTNSRKPLQLETQFQKKAGEILNFQVHLALPVKACLSLTQALRS